MSTTSKTPRRARMFLIGIAATVAMIGGASTVEAQYPPEEPPSSSVPTPPSSSVPTSTPPASDSPEEPPASSVPTSTPPASDSAPPAQVAAASPSGALPATGSSGTSTIVMFAGLTLLAGFAVSIWAASSKRRHGTDDLLGTSTD